MKGEDLKVFQAIRPCFECAKKCPKQLRIDRVRRYYQ
jgi:hypothetical protein